jgi:hypothetical protein
MSDFINKVITIVLIFVMLVLAPLLISYMSTDMTAERLILNDVTQFIDKVTDKYTITDYDLNDLYLAVNSHGGAYEVIVDRYQLYEEPAPESEGGTRILYIRQDDAEQLADDLNYPNVTSIDLNKKDIVKVKVKEVALSSGKRLFWSIMRVDKGKLEFSLAGTVR